MRSEQTPRLLIVEDDRRTQESLARLFSERGWRISSATPTADGLNQLDPPPRCVLIDLSLPDATGALILRTIRAADRPIRVVVCTGCVEHWAIAATTAAESIPPERNAPTGTSATSRRRVAARISSRTRSHSSSSLAPSSLRE